MTGIARYFIRKAHGRYKKRKEAKLKAQRERQTNFRKGFITTAGTNSVKGNISIDKSALPHRGSRFRLRRRK